MTIHPRDIISAEVQYLGSGEFTESILDVTTAQSFSKTATVSGAMETSAQWIAQAPFADLGLLPMADFGFVFWGFEYTHISGTDYATVSGYTGPIGSFATAIAIQSVCYPSGSPAKAVPSVLLSDKSSFSIRWVSPGPEG
jgi:hypothetical protein